MFAEHPHQRTQVLREKSLPLATLPWPPCRPLQLSAVSITSHLARTRERPGDRGLPSPPRAPPTHSGCLQPRTPRPARPAVSSSSARSTFARRPEALPPLRGPRSFPPQAQVVAAPGPARRSAHLGAGGRLPRARHRQTPRRLRGPQRHGPCGLRVHARRPAAPRPGRRAAT